MKQDKKTTRLAKRLLDLSKDTNGVLTESRVLQILTTLRKTKHIHHLKVLKVFLRYVRREIARQTALVSAAVPMEPSAIRKIEAHFTEIYKRPIRGVTQQDSSLIAGVRVRVGDDVYEASISGYLKQLAQNIH